MNKNSHFFGQPVYGQLIDKFDKTLEEKGLGDDYFRKKEEQLKEMELEHDLPSS